MWDGKRAKRKCEKEKRKRKKNGTQTHIRTDRIYFHTHDTTQWKFHQQLILIECDRGRLWNRFVCAFAVHICHETETGQTCTHTHARAPTLQWWYRCQQSTQNTQNHHKSLVWNVCQPYTPCLVRNSLSLACFERRKANNALPNTLSHPLRVMHAHILISIFFVPIVMFPHSHTMHEIP